MSEKLLKKRIIEALWRVTDRHNDILSATLTGSFVNSETLEGLSDIDFVVVVEQLNSDVFTGLQAEFREAVEPVLAEAGYAFRLNPTLGPLKFNAPKLAVLHLMLYSRQAHVEHVIKSPFTCLDWQQSPYYRKRSLAEVYPTFGLQPKHFLSARRSISDYLRDFRDSTVSYRELVCDSDGYSEKKCGKPMDNRDRHEFAYHVMRFLMLNLLKLVRRHDAETTESSVLMDRFYALFPQEEEQSRPLLIELAEKKRKIEYDVAIKNLDQRLERFVQLFEDQFRDAFITTASRHIVFRHAATEMNQKPIRFLGRNNPPIKQDQDEAFQSLQQAAVELNPACAYESPLDRCRQSLDRVCEDDLPRRQDDRLIEINYGKCEALTVAECQREYPGLFESWHRSEDPHFPEGENTADVTGRSQDFVAEHWSAGGSRTVVCTHNVVIRSLVGEALGVPPSERHRIQVPHLAPIHFVATKNFGVFVELQEDVERQLFSSFVCAK